MKVAVRFKQNWNGAGVILATRKKLFLGNIWGVDSEKTWLQAPFQSHSHLPQDFIHTTAGWFCECEVSIAFRGV